MQADAEKPRKDDSRDEGYGDDDGDQDGHADTYRLGAALSRARLSLPTLMIGRVGLRVTVALSGETLRSGEVLSLDVIVADAGFPGRMHESRSLTGRPGTSHHPT